MFYWSFLFRCRNSRQGFWARLQWIQTSPERRRNPLMGYSSDNDQLVVRPAYLRNIFLRLQGGLLM